MRSPSRPLVWLLAALLPAAGLGAQAPLSLAEALHRADEQAFGNRIAAAQARSAAARSTATLRGVLPALRVEAGWVRSDDPLAAFGFLLRQRAVTAQAFDPATLNQPPARSDVSTGLVLEAPLLNADAWAGRRAAGLMGDAAAAHADWIRSGTQLDVIRAYYSAILAREQVTTLAAALTAAAGHVRDADAAVASGLATHSDALLASVREGNIAAQLVAARSAAAIARLRLALAMGTPADTAWLLPGSLPAGAPLPAESAAVTSRGDVREASASSAAARADQHRADLALLPRVNAFGRYDWHDAGSLAAGQAMWTVGVMATWSPFTGGAELADRQRAAADAEAAASGASMVVANAAVERQAAAASLTVAEQVLGIARNSVSQASEAHRIVARKYAGGLAAVTELLDAQAAELAARLAAARAAYDLVMAQAELARANGSNLTSLAAAVDASAEHPE